MCQFLVYRVIFDSFRTRVRLPTSPPKTQKEKIMSGLVGYLVTLAAGAVLGVALAKKGVV